MPSTVIKTKALCACGCGRRFTPVRYTHRYATAECYQLHYRKESPTVYDPVSRQMRRQPPPAPNIPLNWMSVTQAGDLFGVVPGILRTRLRKILRKKEGVEGFNTFELIRYFLDHKKKFANVVNRLRRYGVVRTCADCGRELPGLQPGDYSVYCGQCARLSPAPAETIETIAETKETSMPLTQSPQVLAPLASLLDAIMERVVALENTCLELRATLAEIQHAPPAPPQVPITDQLAAEVAYLKEAIRKAHNAVEDQGIRSSAVESRLVRLEQDLGVPA